MNAPLPTHPDGHHFHVSNGLLTVAVTRLALLLWCFPLSRWFRKGATQ